MGSCASVHRNTETDMKFKLSLGSKADKIVIPPSPVKEKPRNDNFPIHGSKEETFFDSKPWIDSDGEDDFYSVNGELTPSRGSSPVHHSLGNSGVKRTPSENRNPGSLQEPSPTERKKKLVELFQDKDEAEGEKKTPDTQNKGEETQVKTTIQDLLPKSAQSTPYISGANSVCSSERSMNEDPLSIREKSGKSVQCCLPSLASCRSFSERRRKMSPAIPANGKP
ncbi:uncharacterized protein At3g27210 [Neltuma alba]|uniref:uncharacterized protein At3g27210 n=1 Tax=Neltuma alba TaxID=207710 RepID=UPI0010A53983|nr:uncharacterized protein At3g27210-like [Prosopis alba]